MQRLFLLAAAAAVPTGVLTGRVPPRLRGRCPLSSDRGTRIADAAGAPLGVIDPCDADAVIVVVGARKVRLPANALQKTPGFFSFPITAAQLEQVFAVSAAFQARTDPGPAPVSLPPPARPVAIAAGESGGQPPREGISPSEMSARPSFKLKLVHPN